MAGSPVHDPATIAYLIEPELYTGKDVYVEIEASRLTMGMTVVDLGNDGKTRTVTGFQKLMMLVSLD